MRLQMGEKHGSHGLPPDLLPSRTGARLEVRQTAVHKERWLGAPMPHDYTYGASNPRLRPVVPDGE